MTAPYININGKLLPAGEALLATDNKAFRYGEALFETMLIKDGAVALFPYHAERLFAGMRQLGFRVPAHFTPEKMEEEVLRTAKKNQMQGRCRGRMQVFPGAGGLFEALDAPAEYVIECFPVDEQITRLNDNGLILGIAEGLQKSVDSLANLKTANALIYAQAARQAKANRWNDALIVNTSGNIIESCIANIFWIKDGIIHTPPLSEGCVAGVLRRRLLTELPVHGFSVKQAPLTVEELTQAEEIFLTNAIRGIKWVAQIAGNFHTNAITTKICSRLFDNQ